MPDGNLTYLCYIAIPTKWPLFCKSLCMDSGQSLAVLINCCCFHGADSPFLLSSHLLLLTVQVCSGAELNYAFAMASDVVNPHLESCRFCCPENCGQSITSSLPTAPPTASHKERLKEGRGQTGKHQRVFYSQIGSFCVLQHAGDGKQAKESLPRLLYWCIIPVCK